MLNFRGIYDIRLHATILFAYWVSVDFKILNPWDKIIKMSKNLTKKETFNINCPTFNGAEPPLRQPTQ